MADIQVQIIDLRGTKADATITGNTWTAAQPRGFGCSGGVVRYNASKATLTAGGAEDSFIDLIGFSSTTSESDTESAIIDGVTAMGGVLEDGTGSWTCTGRS